MRKLVDKALMPISRNPGFYLALILLFGISIVHIEYARCSRMRALLEMFGDVYLLCAVLTLLPPKVRRWAKFLLFGIFWMVGLADMISYEVMGIALVPNIVQTWLQTNWHEATEAMHIHLTPRLLITPVSLLLLLPILLFFIKKKVIIPRKAAFFLLLLSCVSVVYGIPNKQYLYGTYARMSDDDIEDDIEVESMTREYLPIYRLGLSIKELRRFSTMRLHLERTVRTTVVDSCSHESPVIVLIIGESYNRHHSSLYGYQLPTTPHQQEYQATGNLYRFDDVIASYNLTYKSFQNMLTLYDYDSAGTWYDYPIVPVMFCQAGYEVMFFSNQNTLDKASAFTDFTEDMFMNNADISRFMFDVRNPRSHQYDMDLVGDYLATASTGKPQLIILHFIGLHADYKLRYPEERKTFAPSDYPSRKDLSEEEKEILADYDNAVRYNDEVVDSILRVFSEKEAVAIYVPDHGELVFDGCREMGRNLINERRYVEPQFDIPFWIYCSDTYKERHPALCRSIEAAVSRPFMTDDLPHLLLSLGGIHTRWYSPERNLIDPQFNVGRVRKIKGEADYDKLRRF